MGLRINNNIAALNSYNSLNRTDKAVSSSLEKLSSGYRINKAADDAAGLVVSEGLRSQIGGLTVAARNAQDGVNVAQTADGALSEVTSILQRMRDLSVQAANTGSTDSNAASAAQAEVDQLNKELDRISATTSFGSQKLLDGTYGVQAAKVTGTGVGAIAAASITAATTFSLAQGTSGTAITVTLATTGGVTYAASAAGALALQTNLQTDINNALTVDNVKVTVTFDAFSNTNVVSLKRTDAPTGDNTKDAIVLNGSVPSSLGLVTGTTNSSGNSSVFQVGANATTNDQISFSIAAITSGVNGLNTATLDLSSAATAQTAISTIDAALKSVSATRATIGAVQNRFEHAINNLNVSIQNITASESAIRDTDMASEMTKFTKNQVLSQAGTSMLAQANSSSQNILTLLRG